MQRQIKLKFWGVRGSLATGTSKFGSSTSCVELKVGPDASLFLDAGTGIRAATQGRQFRNLMLCLSHFHWDHIQGFPFISGLGDSNFKMKVVSGFSDMEQRLSVLFDPRFYPVALNTVKPNLDYQIMRVGEPIEFEQLRVTTAPLNHPGVSYAFRIEGDAGSFVFATDTDYDPVPSEAEQLMKGADWVILDSQFLIGDSLKKANYGHASFKSALDTAARLRVKNAILFHFDPNYTDDELERLEKQARDYALTTFGTHGPTVHMAREGMELDLYL